MLVSVPSPAVVAMPTMNVHLMTMLLVGNVRMQAIERQQHGAEAQHDAQGLGQDTHRRAV